MRMRLLVALAAGLMVGSEPVPDLGEVAQPQVIPQGSRWVWNGDELSLTYEFGKGGVCRISRSGRHAWTVLAKYTLTPTASPPRIDMIDFVSVRRCPGIYRLESDRLLICIGEWDAVARPTTFADRPKAGQYLYVLKRLK